MKEIINKRKLEDERKNAKMEIVHKRLEHSIKELSKKCDEYHKKALPFLLKKEKTYAEFPAHSPKEWKEFIKGHNNIKKLRAELLYKLHMLKKKKNLIQSKKRCKIVKKSLHSMIKQKNCKSCHKKLSKIRKICRSTIRRLVKEIKKQRKDYKKKIKVINKAKRFKEKIQKHKRTEIKEALKLCKISHNGSTYRRCFQQKSQIINIKYSHKKSHQKIKVFTKKVKEYKKKLVILKKIQQKKI